MSLDLTMLIQGIDRPRKIRPMSDKPCLYAVAGDYRFLSITESVEMLFLDLDLLLIACGRV